MIVIRKSGAPTGFKVKGLLFGLLLTGQCLWVNAGTDGSSIFVETAAASGLNFLHFNGMTGDFLVPEEQGSGVALFDFDNDGDLDVYLLQGHLLGVGKTMKDAIFPPDGKQPLTDRLFRNDLGSAKGNGSGLTFVDITEKAGIKADRYGVGVAAADYDNDGDVDLYVLNYGPNQMWRNNGDGTFSDVTEATRTGDSGWGVSASFFDYDRDGWLDLYVPNYIIYTYENHKTCLSATGVRDYCGPNSYDDAPDRLFRNLGDGTFADVTAKAGLKGKFGAGLGIVTADLNGDRWVDVYIANDADPNLFFINQKNGTFIEDALLAGCAVNSAGAPEASMGIEAFDVDGDGDEDLLMTHLTGESHTLFINDGHGGFEDKTNKFGLNSTTLEATGFGTASLDFDNDGWQDLFVANGTVMAVEKYAQRGDPFPLHQTNQLFRNMEGQRFKEVTSLGGPAFLDSEVSRGAAMGDIDNDGDSDIVFTNNSGPVRLMINQVGTANRWLGVRALDGKGIRDQLGAMLILERKGGPPLYRRLHSDGSFASSKDPRVLFGLGPKSEPVRLRVIWPNGKQESWDQLGINKYITIFQGKGTPSP